MATPKEQSDARPQAVNVGEAVSAERERIGTAEERAAAASPSWERTINAAKAHASDHAKEQANTHAEHPDEQSGERGDERAGAHHAEKLLEGGREGRGETQ